VMMRWFDATAARRWVTGEMIRTKLYTSHSHHWVLMVFSLSRLIHWMREAALFDSRTPVRVPALYPLSWSAKSQ
jgi:hypothetical protein